MFCLMVKAKVVAYKKAIGNEPDHDQLKQILYVCMDMTSKNLASQSGLDRKGYVDLCEDIGRRYRLQFERLDFAKAAKGDDPMGLSLMYPNAFLDSDKAQEPPAPEEPERSQLPKEDLDAVGKEKGKGKSDGKCNICGGQGHYSRDCPSTTPLSETTCHGCDGKGHYKNVCPTANPHLKGGGGGKGWKTKGGGGKGNGGWNTKGGKGQGKGKGKGKDGKGLYELDLMNQWGGQWDQQGSDKQGWDERDDGSQGGPYLR